jgi:hypothetical protein
LPTLPEGASAGFSTWPLGARTVNCGKAFTPRAPSATSRCPAGTSNAVLVLAWAARAAGAFVALV